MSKFLAPNFAPELITQLRNYGKLMRVDKPVGVWLLLWPTLWAVWLAGEGTPDPNCSSASDDRERVRQTTGCGIGPELLFLAPLSALWARRRR